MNGSAATASSALPSSPRRCTAAQHSAVAPAAPSHVHNAALAMALTSAGAVLLSCSVSAKSEPCCSGGTDNSGGGRAPALSVPCAHAIVCAKDVASSSSSALIAILSPRSGWNHAH